jgi:pimeloyl-ACP methyl ester carboxylesterase
MGKTDTPKSKLAKGIPEWATAVEEILDLLRIEQCSVMAHSAGAPYALSFANRCASRIRGDVLLLAPWVGGVDAGMHVLD